MSFWRFLEETLVELIVGMAILIAGRLLKGDKMFGNKKKRKEIIDVEPEVICKNELVSETESEHGSATVSPESEKVQGDIEPEYVTKDEFEELEEKIDDEWNWFRENNKHVLSRLNCESWHEYTKQVNDRLEKLEKAINEKKEIIKHRDITIAGLKLSVERLMKKNDEDDGDVTMDEIVYDQEFGDDETPKTEPVEPVGNPEQLDEKDKWKIKYEDACHALYKNDKLEYRVATVDYLDNFLSYGCPQDVIDEHIKQEQDKKEVNKCSICGEIIKHGKLFVARLEENDCICIECDKRKTLEERLQKYFDCYRIINNGEPKKLDRFTLDEIKTAVKDYEAQEYGLFFDHIIEKLDSIGNQEKVSEYLRDDKYDAIRDKVVISGYNGMPNFPCKDCLELDVMAISDHLHIPELEIIADMIILLTESEA